MILVLATALLRRHEEDKQLHTVRILHGDVEDGTSNTSNRQSSVKFNMNCTKNTKTSSVLKQIIEVVNTD